MALFHRLRVADVRKETHECISVAFDVPADLRQEFEYVHGQYVTLKIQVNGEELRRSYSICSSPVADDELRIAVKKVKGGRGSGYLNEKVKPGDYLEVMPPMGNFYTLLDPAHRKHYVAFAAGSGITPVISILKTVLHKEPQSRFTLFYGNRKRPTIIFKDQLHHLQEKYGSRLEVFHILTGDTVEDNLFSGRIDEEKVKLLIQRYVPLSQSLEFFLCGPEEMIEGARTTLLGMSIEKKNVHIELFSTPVKIEQGEKLPEASKKHGGPMESEVTVIMDGQETKFSLSSDGLCILDAALRADVDVPFACKGAVCCTCKAKLIEGKVEMDMNYVLSDEEVQEGYILTCQSHPVTPKVVVNYDEGV